VAGGGEVVERLRGHSGRLGERLLGCAAGLGWGDAAGGDEVVLEGEGGGGVGEEAEAEAEAVAVVDRGGELGGGADEREEAISEAQHDGAAEGRRRRRWVSLRGQI